MLTGTSSRRRRESPSLVYEQLSLTGGYKLKMDMALLQQRLGMAREDSGEKTVPIDGVVSNTAVPCLCGQRRLS